MAQLKSSVDPPPSCPKCGGEVVIVNRRAWCIRPIGSGGCGTFVQLSTTGTPREAWT